MNKIGVLFMILLCIVECSFAMMLRKTSDCMYDYALNLKYYHVARAGTCHNEKDVITRCKPDYKDHKKRNLIELMLNATHSNDTAHSFDYNVIGFAYKKYFVDGKPFDGPNFKILIGLVYRKECQTIPSDEDFVVEIDKMAIKEYDFAVKNFNYTKPLYLFKDLSILNSFPTKEINPNSKLIESEDNDN